MTIKESDLAHARRALGCVLAASQFYDGLPVDERMGGPVAAGMRATLSKLLNFDETYVPAEWLSEMDGFDVPAMVDRLVTACPEIDIPDHMIDRVEVVWKRKAGSTQGATVLGTCKPIGKRERETWQGVGPAPWWRLTLALDVWIAMTDEQRWRLVHHELMHATYKGNEQSPRSPAGRCHDVEEFAATVARYGIATETETQAKTFAQVMARPKVTEEVRRWDCDPATGQGLLFAVTLEAVGV